MPLADMIVSPLARMVVTSPFGYRIHPITKVRSFHNGVDLKGREGDPIAAPVGGRVTYNTHPSGGLQAILVCPEGLRFGFAHLSAKPDAVSSGDTVPAGSVIGYVGRSGRVTGPHLHMTVAVKVGDHFQKVNPNLIPFG